MKKNLLKIIIIAACFTFVLVISLVQLKNAPEERNPNEENLSEERSEEADASEEHAEPKEVTEEIELVNNPDLRILITSSDFSNDIHEKVKVTSDKDFKLLGEDGTLYAEYNAWEIIDLDDFGLKEGENLIFESQSKMSVLSLSRAQGTPEYYGKLQIYKEDNGYSVVNIVPLEKYLLTVVPSEMLSTYPLEALKAQAICARSYAYHYVVNSSGLVHDVHMNDSTDFQVYNNIQETEATNRAVQETEGMILTENGMPVPTYFFSTSCGFTTNETVWKEYFGGMEIATGETPKVAYQAGSNEEHREIRFESVTVAEPQAVEAMSTGMSVGILYTADALAQEQNFRAYIKSDASDFLEAEEQWYRWSYHGSIDSAVIGERLAARYGARPDLILTLDETEGDYVNQPIETIGTVTNIEVIKRLPGGVADELKIETTKDSYLVIGEYNIRYVLSDGVSEIIRNDGTAVTVSSLLPSAYFIIEPETESSEGIKEIYLTGGGYGHGVGMSQNGARQAALRGMDCEDILELFYKGLELRKIK